MLLASREKSVWVEVQLQTSSVGLNDVVNRTDERLVVVARENDNTPTISSRSLQTFSFLLVIKGDVGL